MSTKTSVLGTVPEPDSDLAQTCWDASGVLEAMEALEAHQQSMARFLPPGVRLSDLTQESVRAILENYHAELTQWLEEIGVDYEISSTGLRLRFIYDDQTFETQAQPSNQYGFLVDQGCGPAKLTALPAFSVNDEAVPFYAIKLCIASHKLRVMLQALGYGVELEHSASYGWSYKANLPGADSSPEAALFGKGLPSWAQIFFRRYQDTVPKVKSAGMTTRVLASAEKHFGQLVQQRAH